MRHVALFVLIGVLSALPQSSVAQSSPNPNRVAVDLPAGWEEMTSEEGDETVPGVETESAYVKPSAMAFAFLVTAEAASFPPETLAKLVHLNFKHAGFHPTALVRLDDGSWSFGWLSPDESMYGSFRSRTLPGSTSLTVGMMTMLLQAPPDQTTSADVEMIWGSLHAR